MLGSIIVELLRLYVKSQKDFELTSACYQLQSVIPLNYVSRAITKGYLVMLSLCGELRN